MPARRVGRKATRKDAARSRARPSGRWATGDASRYEPEKSETAAFLVPTEQYVKRFLVAESFTHNADGTPLKETLYPEFDGVLMAPVMSQGHLVRLKPTRIIGIPALRQFFESETGKSKRLLEATGDDFMYGGEDMLLASTGTSTRYWDREVIPLMNGPYFKQLYWYDYLAMHARAFELVNYSPLAASAIKIMTRFVVGRGISFNVKDPHCEAVWTEFWQRNDMRSKTRQSARDLPWQGELLFRYYERKPGYVTIRVVDPSSCQEIVTDPEDLEHVYYYHFMYPTMYQMFPTGMIPISKYVVQQVPPTSVQHVKINVSSQEKRGRSDLLPALAWIKRFNDYYNGVVVKAILEANLVWKLKVQGDDSDMQRILADPHLTQLPPPGGTWIENEAMELSAISGQLTASRGSAGIGQQIASIVATSMNLPAEYFNIEGTGPARATALVRTDPAVKTVEDRQQILHETLEEIYDRVIEAALIAGRIPRQAARHEPERVAGDPDQDRIDDTLRRHLGGQTNGIGTGLDARRRPEPPANGREPVTNLR